MGRSGNYLKQIVAHSVVRVLLIVAGVTTIGALVFHKAGLDTASEVSHAIASASLLFAIIVLVISIAEKIRRRFDKK